MTDMALVDSSMKTRFLDMIKKANRIVITTHVQPDADGIGSEISLCLALKQIGKEVYCVHNKPLLERYSYLDREGVIQGFDQYYENYGDEAIDLFIVADTNTLTRIGEGPRKLIQNSKELLFIDHHPCPKELKAIHCIDTDMAATGQLVGHLIEAMKVPFTKEMALPLYTAILIDTSSFRYPTVTGSTHKLIGKLLDTGIEPSSAYNYIYGTKKISHIQFLGEVLSRSKTNEDQSIAWIALDDELMNKFDADPEDTHAFINHLLILDQVKVVCMFRELPKKKVKISLRSSGNIDVGILAQAIGGGGHNHSAATVVEGKLKKVIPEIIKKLESMLGSSK